MHILRYLSLIIMQLGNVSVLYKVICTHWPEYYAMNRTSFVSLSESFITKIDELSSFA